MEGDNKLSYNLPPDKQEIVSNTREVTYAVDLREDQEEMESRSSRSSSSSSVSSNMSNETETKGKQNLNVLFNRENNNEFITMIS